MAAIQYHAHKKENADATLARVKKKITTNAFSRFAAFASIFGFMFGMAETSLILAVCCSILSLIAFLALVGHHVRLHKKRKYWQAVSIICTNEIEACNHVFSSFQSGKGYIDPKHTYSYDLDLFGSGSVFQMINRTVTTAGEKKLADILLHGNTNVRQIIIKQESIMELASTPDLLTHFRAVGSTSEIVEEDKKKIGNWTNTKSYVSNNRTLNIIRILFPSLTLLSLVFLISAGTGALLFVSLFLLNLTITGFFFKKTNVEHNRVSAFLNLLKKYKGLLSSFGHLHFSSELLQDIVSELHNEHGHAETALSDLSKKVNAFDSRLNFVAAIVLQGLLLWDFQCLFGIEKWRQNYGQHLLKWLSTIAEFDSLVSMATYAFNNPNYIYPNPNAATILETKGIGHPLIPASVRVANSFLADKKGGFIIITGANMAGKSTFLRTIGVNLVLAMAGMPVCAETFNFKPTNLFTSMRTSDSLSENESYFYAELRRLKEIIDSLEEGKELFIILDEILKGTNSVDKQKGSQMGLEKILRLGGTGIIATHDLALTKIEEKHPGKIKNQCFEVEIDNTTIKFDYKLYNGVTQKMNAIILMEQMGII